MLEYPESGSRNGGRVILQIDKAQAPAGLAASYMSTVKFHNHIHLDRL